MKYKSTIHTTTLMDGLREWIRAAEAARVTCLNAHEFDVLIQRQKQRLETMAAIKVPITPAEIGQAAGGTVSGKAQGLGPDGG
jgi:hypothetical protein